MHPRVGRREFLGTIGVAAAASCLPYANLYARAPLYPPMDLSHFDIPIPPAPSEIHFGYAAITWDGNDRQAIEDISALGFHGIQVRSNALEEFGSAAALRESLQKHQLKLVALSSGDLSLDPAAQSSELARHTEHAKFLRDAGGLYLQVVDKRPQGRPLASADYKRLGQLLTELGKRTADLGVSLGYHNHMGSCGEHPEAIDQILEAVDPRYAKLELDVAHYFQGGGDPAKAIEKYSDRLLFLHIKDVEQLPASNEKKDAYRFVELGRGQVNLPSVFDALHKVNFRGWAVVELDSVPDKSRTPKESGEISRKYLQEKLGVTL